MAHAAGREMTNSQGSRAGDGPSLRVRALFSMRGRRTSPQPDRPPRGLDHAGDPGLARQDALSEAATSLSLGDGVPFTGREYQLFELLWRTEP
jgi:hypothetical protein